MIELLNWATTIAYLTVFFLGLGFCFYLSKKYFTHRNVFKAASTFSLAVLALGGLIQAFAGV